MFLVLSADDKNYVLRLCVSNEGSLLNMNRSTTNTVSAATKGKRRNLLSRKRSRTDSKLKRYVRRIAKFWRHDKFLILRLKRSPKQRKARTQRANRYEKKRLENGKKNANKKRRKGRQRGTEGEKKGNKSLTKNGRGREGRQRETKSANGGEKKGRESYNANGRKRERR